MGKHGSARWLVGCVAALTLGYAASTQAQDTTRTRTDTTRKVTTTTQKVTATTQTDTTKYDSTKVSAKMRTSTKKVTSQKRIRVSKGESGGEVMLQPNQDSIAAAERARLEQLRQDSLANIERMRQDSLNAIARARQDSIDREKARNDSIAAVAKARQDSIARADSLAQIAHVQSYKAPKMSHGFYVGFAAGPSSPMSTFKDIGYSTGYDIMVPIGWQANNQLLGFRVDLGYSNFKGTSYSTVMTSNVTDTATGAVTPVTSNLTLTNPNAKVYSAVANLTARFPLTPNKQTGFYLVGGGGWYHFGSYGASSALSGYLGNTSVITTASTTGTTTTTTTTGTTYGTTPTTTGTTTGTSYSSNYKNSFNKFGVDAGAGLDFGIGSAALFVESRFTQVFGGNMNNLTINSNGTISNNSKNLRWVPIVLGIKFH